MAIRCLLDTNICIYIAKHSPPTVRARFEQLRADMIAMSVATLGELRFGAEKSKARDKSLAALQQLESSRDTVHFLSRTYFLLKINRLRSFKQIHPQPCARKTGATRASAASLRA